MLSGTGRSAADFDAGDVAVVQADPTILQPGEDIDLAGRAILFAPGAGGGYTLGSVSGSIDPSLGTNLGLGDDASTGAQPLGFNFPFFGVNYTTIFINSNGYVTLGGASSFINFNSIGATDLSTVLDRMAGGFPRIAAFWNDLDPSAGGGVFFTALPDRVRITWNGVPRFSSTSPNPNPPNTVQLTLFQSGVIQLTYGSLGPLSTDPIFGGALVGISPGSADAFRVTTLDLSTGSGGSVSALPNAEPLVQVFGTMPQPLAHVLAVARRFYRTHGDLFDQLLIFANFGNALGDAFAFEVNVRVSAGGMGLPIFDDSSLYGSAGRLHSVVNLGALSQYPPDPMTTFLGTNNTVDLIAHETGHQWLAFLRFDDNGMTSDLLLGRQLAHWSFIHDTNASVMEGNRFADNGNGTFTTVEATARFSALDQYAMGLRPASEVSDFFFVRNPSPVNPCGTGDPTGGRACPPKVGVTVSGTRQNVSISQIFSIEGARPFGLSGANPTTVWHQEFVLLVPTGTTPSSSDLGKLAAMQTAWVSFFGNAVDGRASIATTPPIPAPVPAITWIGFVAVVTLFVGLLTWNIVRTGRAIARGRGEAG
ncbi:MAG: hypothetical protein ACREIN_02755 [Candidatus Methylomirabilaceae bacterium]